MNSSDAVSETNTTERVPEIPDAVTSAMESLAPPVAQRFGSGNFATVAGAISLFRAIRSFRKGDRKRAALRGVVGLFWVGVALAQRRRSSDGSGTKMAEVADTSPDVEDAVDPGGRDTDHAAGTDVVDTTNADIESSDTSSEVGESDATGRETADAADADVDQRDVVGTGIEDAAETDEENAAEGEDDVTAGTDDESDEGTAES